MPFARISLRQGHSPEFLRAMSDSLHSALVECFDVPEADLFQLIHQHAPGEMVFDRHYLGGPRSEDFVLIHLTAGKPRSVATKQAFYRRLAERLSQSPGLAPANLMVVIQHNQAEDWSFADGKANLVTYN